MKKFKLLSLLAFFALSSFFFVGCEEEDNPLSSDKPIPTAPTNLRATSASATSVMLRWDKSIHEDSTWFAGYELTVTGGNPIAPKTITKTQPYEVTGLEAGVVYTFTLKALNTDNKTSTGSTSVIWSPAARFETADIKMYVFESSNGSGLSLYDATNKKPMNLKAADKAKWHLGFDNRDNNALWFGSASLIDIGSATPADVVEFADNYWPSNTLNTVFENAALSSMNYAPRKINLLTLDLGNEGVVFAIRIKKQGETNYNYAKVLVEKSTAGFLFGTGNDRYIKLKVSYQTTANVPYAK